MGRETLLDVGVPASWQERAQGFKERTLPQLQPHQSPGSPPIIYENFYYFGLGTSHRAKGVSKALLDSLCFTAKSIFPLSLQ
jgi:hypothetical protein